VVWQIDRKELADAGYKLGCIQDVVRLANGDTVFSNWIPNDVKDPAQWHTTAQPGQSHLKDRVNHARDFRAAIP
jgi:hypothetical protein